MTNSEWFKEWIKNKIDEMTDDELSDFICYEYAAPKDDMNYKIFTMEWLNQKHQSPMPELKDGMFVCCTPKYNINNTYGTIVDLAIIKEVDSNNLGVKYCFDSGWDYIEDVEIKAIYNATCVDRCNDETCIWRKE